MRASTTIPVLLFLAAAAAPARAQTVEEARLLYAGASYAEALGVLSQLADRVRDAADVHELLRYRALCLLALGRSQEAEAEIGHLVRLDPFYTPSEVDAPPQFRELVRAVRERTLPALVREQYGAARQAYDASADASSVAAFERVLALLETPEAQAGLGPQAAADLRTLADSFLLLARSRERAAAPAAAAAGRDETASRPESGPDAGEAATASATPNEAAGPVSEAPAGDPDIFDASHAGITAPEVVQQSFPRVPTHLAMIPRQGVLEVVIGADGRVQSAVLHRRVNPLYDRLLLEQTKTWRYTAATKDGAPVRYRKFIAFTLSGS